MFPLAMVLPRLVMMRKFSLTIYYKCFKTYIANIKFRSRF